MSDIACIGVDAAQRRRQDAALAALSNALASTEGHTSGDSIGDDDDGATPSCMLRDDTFAMKERFLDQSWTPPTEAVPNGAGGT